MTYQLRPISLLTQGGANFDGIDPLDGRYFDQDVARFISERSRIAYQAHIEAALALTLAEFDICSAEVAEEIAEAASEVVAEDVYIEEQLTRHDIKALVNTIKKNISDDAKPFVHFGATSYDIIATAQALQMKSVIQESVLPAFKLLLKTLADMAVKYADTPQVGRTHGQHAVPITFGFAMAEYVARLDETISKIEALSNELHGKFSGAVGAYNALSVFVDDPLKFEESVLAKVGLQPAPYATQIVPPEGMVRLINEMAIAAGILANLSHDMRHLQRTEIAEVREKFEPGQTGSSTMAHKRNPWNFENVISLRKQIVGQALNANLNLASEHQRDLTDSASSRFYVLVPALLANMIKRLYKVMGKMEIDETAMQRNLDLSAGAIAAEPLYLLLEKYGHTQAHEMAKQIAHDALHRGVSLADAVQADEDGAVYWKKFSAKERAIIEHPDKKYTGLSAKKTRLIVKQANNIKA